MSITERQKRVLAAIVADYIHTAEPVGSRTISKKYNLGVSSATIRNEMADLEEEALIEQPHTSAGRTPTDLGYRYYVDYILPEELGDLKANPGRFAGWLAKGPANDESAKTELTALLARYSRYAAMLFLPPGQERDDEPVMAMLSLMYLAPGRVLMVVVSDDEQVRNEILEPAPHITERDVAAVESLLNHYLRGLPARHWAEPLANYFTDQGDALSRFIRLAVHRLGEVLAQDQVRRFYLAGALNMLDLPEFQEHGQMRQVLSLLQGEDTLMEVLSQSRHAKGALLVKIGQETERPDMQALSLMCAAFQAGVKPGWLALLGPKRMDYAQSARLLLEAVAAVETAFGTSVSLVPERSTDLAPLFHSFAWQLRNRRM